MKVYLHEIILHFQSVAYIHQPHYTSIYEKGKKIDYKTLKGNILIQLENIQILDEIITNLLATNGSNIISITFDWGDKKTLKKYLKSRFHYIKAAGGLAMKEGKYLFIFRLKKWDLPKGKLEKNEDILACALREVEEECSVKVLAGPRIGNTWHCYFTKNGWCIKKTTWYKMACIDDSEMKPQYQEDIEDIAWVAPENVEKYLKNSYGTIQDVFEKARKKNLLNQLAI